MKHSSLLSILGAVLVVAALVAPSWAMEGDETGVRLSLDEALRIALGSNLDLIAARKDPRIARFQFDVAAAEFDSALDANATYTDGSSSSDIVQTVPVARTGTGESDSTSKDFSVGWGQKVSFGANYRIGYRYRTVDDNSEGISVYTGLPTRDGTGNDTGTFAFSYAMPLLKGFGKEVNEIDLLLAQSNLEISLEELRLQAHDVVKQVEDAYWDLLAVRAALDVARESLKLAQDLLDLNRKKVEVGTMAPIEVTQAEAGVASREEGVILAETAVANAEDQLRRLLAYPESDTIWDKRIVPTDRPDLTKRSVTLDSAIETALERRPEIVTAKRALEDQRLSERVAKKNVRHQLDLTANVYRGSDTLDLAFFQENPPPDLPTNTVSSTDSSGTNWDVALKYVIPIGNRAAKADYTVATLNREKSEIGLQRAEQEVRVDVRIAVRNVESSIKRVDAAHANTILQRKTLDAEQKKFENGMSTSFEVLRIQTDLSNAQVAEIRANLDYMKSLADLERAQGTLLEARGLRLEETEDTE